MPLSTSHYVTFVTAVVTAVISVIGTIWVMNRQRQKQAVFEASNKFKSLLTEDLPNYESEKTTFSACILELYPKHRAELDQLLIHLPKSKRKKVVTAWEPYDQLYREKKMLGVFGAVTMELPHPDLDPSLENVRQIERKRKMQVVKVLNEVKKML